MAFDFENNVSTIDDYTDILKPCAAIAEWFNSYFKKRYILGVDFVYNPNSDKLEILFDFESVHKNNYAYPSALLFRVLYDNYGPSIREFLDHMCIVYDRKNCIHTLFKNKYIETTMCHAHNEDLFVRTNDGIQIVNMEWFAYLVRFCHMEQFNCEAYMYRHFHNFFTLTDLKNKNGTGFVYFTPAQLHEFAVYFLKDNHQVVFGDDALIASVDVFKSQKPIKNLLFISLMHCNIKLKGIKNFSDFSHLSMFDICTTILKTIKTRQNIV